MTRTEQIAHFVRQRHTLIHRLEALHAQIEFQRAVLDETDKRLKELGYETEQTKS